MRRRPGLAWSLAGGVGILLVGLAIVGLGAGVRTRSFTLAALSHRLGRTVHVDGELSLHPHLTSFTVRFTRLHVDQPAWATPGAMVWVDRGTVTLPWTSLLGDVRLQDVQLDGLRLDLRHDSQGRPNWSDGRARPPPRLPRIARMALRNGGVAYQDPSRALSFQGAISVASGATGPPVLAVAGHGRIEDGVWTLDARSTADFKGSAPYILSGHLTVAEPSGNSDARFSGGFAPRDGHLQATVAATGPDLHDLSHLINVPLPHTPPYSLQTRIERTPERTRLQGLSGRVGASDIAGAMTITPAPGGRHLDGALRSRSLRVSDLLSVASGGQLSHARRQGRLLPEVAINPAPLRRLSGVVRLSAASVQARSIRSLRLVATFDRGRVAAAPLTLDLAHGQAKIEFVLDVRRSVPQVRLDVDLQRADTSDFRQPGGAPAPLQAVLDGAIHLQGAGSSLALAASHASGSVQLTALTGRLQRKQAAVLSGDMVQGVLSLLARKPADTPLRCAVARFQVRDGKARATALRVVSGLGAVTGSGGFNLASETLDLTLRPAAPAMADVTAVRIAGPLAHPRATLALGGAASLISHTFDGLFKAAFSPPPSLRCG
ncbi:AsmA-like C-terminal region-containing protein [Caulobacter sp. S45]|uniref:AsmA family protein n=1 Tax=Caulobacter sp. S45 TaxID=1641861 RepID=UPI0015759C6C|nr:AsmA-like C-terminal region-containing protein [Caulobacter sp. S45]